MTQGRPLNLERAKKNHIELLTFPIIKVLPLFYSNLLTVLGHDKSKALIVLHKDLGLQPCDGPMLTRSFLLSTTKVHLGKFVFCLFLF